jgi:hypothetical protein
MVIDGHAFCSGLELLKPDFEYSISLVTNLMRGAAFRTGNISQKQGRFSLEICSLGRLVDMYHTYKATILHDKVYALLGMSSDDSIANLELDYDIPWRLLMQNLVTFVLGNRVSVDTWDNREIAVIKSKGYILGRVSTISTNRDGSDIELTLQSTRLHSKMLSTETYWTFPPSAKSIKPDDLVCLLHGARRPTIIRLFEDHYIIVVLSVTSPDYAKQDWTASAGFPRDFLLVWDWEETPEKLNDSGKYKALMRTELDSALTNAIKAWNLAQILGDARFNSQAEEKEQEAEQLERALMKEDPMELEIRHSFVPLLWASTYGYKDVVKLLLMDGANVRVNDWRGRSALSCAAGNGHETIVELLLEANAAVNTDDEENRTPLSWAAGNGHEAIVKLLLKTKVDAHAGDNDARTPLSWAAANGHEAVVKLLLLPEADGDLPVVYVGGRTPLWLAATNGHEAVV